VKAIEASVARAWLLAALWRPLGPVRRGLRLAQRPRAADLLVIVGTLTLPFLGEDGQFARLAPFDDSGPGHG